MQRFRVKGADARTGEDVDKVFEAADYETAKQIVAASQIYPESISREALAEDHAPPAAAAPELFWFGEMICNECGYQWKARRDTPPAKCASCRRKNITAVRRPKAAGCLTLLALALTVATLASWFAGRMLATVM